MSIENKLKKYNGYKPGTVSKWKSQLATSPQCIRKILANLQIIDSRKIRILLRKIVAENTILIEKENSFFCKFGQPGKSGEILIYEFYHTFPKYKNKVIESWEISALPESSTVIFLDDLVGTGKQSKTHIINKLNLLLNPSHDAFLLCLCATHTGIKTVEENTNVTVLPALILDEESHQYLSDQNNIFSLTEKDFLRDINNRLHDSERAYYAELGLLLAFYFAVPNNTLPFIWKDKANYIDNSGSEKKWCALLPRCY